MTLVTSGLSPAFTFDDPIDYEPAIQCDLMFRKDGQSTQCPNEAVWDVVVNCAHDHEATRFWCERCLGLAKEGKVDCRDCRTTLRIPARECPVSVILIYKRNRPDAG